MPDCGEIELMVGPSAAVVEAVVMSSRGGSTSISWEATIPCVVSEEDPAI